MPAIANIDDIYKQQARGKFVTRMGTSGTGASTNAGTSACGFFTLSFTGNAIGTTLPNTFGEFAIPSGITADLTNLASLSGSSLSARGCAFFRIYKVGTINLAATGNQFTHDTATFPLLRSEFGVSNKAQALWPVLQVTAVTATNQAVMTFTYVNQIGSSVTGARTLTLPAAATSASSAFFIPLEQGDWAAQDITAMNITTAATAGTATVWLAEEIDPSTNLFATCMTADFIAGYGLKTNNQTPAVATSGTVTTATVTSLIGATGSYVASVWNMSVLS